MPYVVRFIYKTGHLWVNSFLKSTRLARLTMPSLGLTMAQPIPKQSRTYVMPSETIIVGGRKDRKYVYLKVAQLVLIIIAAVSLLVGVYAWYSNAKLVVAAGLLGALLVYPTLLLFFPLDFTEVRNQLIICNVLASIMSATAAFVVMKDWYYLQSSLDNPIEDDSAFYELQKSVTCRLIVVVVSFKTAILYLSEVAVMTLEKLQYI